MSSRVERRGVKKEARKGSTKDGVVRITYNEAEQKYYLELVQLKQDADSWRGRDAKDIARDLKALRARIEAARETQTEVRDTAQKAMLKELKAALKEVESEHNMEEKFNWFLHRAAIVVTSGPMAVTLLEALYEVAKRPALVAAAADLAGHTAVITGGCGALGAELALLLAAHGSRVVLGCRGLRGANDDDEFADADGAVPDDDDDDDDALVAEEGKNMGDRASRRLALADRIAAEGLAFQGGEEEQQQQGGWIRTLDVDLASFASTRRFGDEVLALFGEESSKLDLLVHAAATTNGCALTKDGQDAATQVNLLAPALLTDTLLPALEASTAATGGRVVYVTCDAGLVLPDWLPFPLRRRTATSLPRIDLDANATWCEALDQYANSKLAATAYSRELAHRFEATTARPGDLVSVASFAVDPGAMDTAFGRTASVKKPRSFLNFFNYLPTAWVMGQVKRHLGQRLDVMGRMLRTASYGALIVYHVATAPSLTVTAAAPNTSPAAVFGPRFDGCGSSRTVVAGEAPATCGRRPDSQIPELARNAALTAALHNKVHEIIEPFKRAAPRMTTATTTITTKGASQKSPHVKIGLESDEGF